MVSIEFDFLALMWYTCSDRGHKVNAHTEEANLGIIESLSAGYRFLSRRLDLLLIPIVLDLFLWVAPRVSVAPLFDRVAHFYNEAASTADLPEEMATLAQQMATALSETGAASNLLNLLLWLSRPLLHLPSLLHVVEPQRSSAPIEVDGLAQMVGSGLFLTLLGLAIGVVFMMLLARHLPIGAAAKSWAWEELPGLALRNWFKVMAFVALLVIALLALFAPVSIAVTLLALVAPGLTTILAFLFGGFIMVLLLYLYFVPVGMIMDGLRLFNAIGQSFRLVRDNFWATLGLLLLSDLISLGFSVMLARLVDFQAVAALAAILVNAFIGTGLALGFMIFYRSRVLRMQGEQYDVEL